MLALLLWLLVNRPMFMAIAKQETLPKKFLLYTNVINPKIFEMLALICESWKIYAFAILLMPKFHKHC
jgi:hypothetical protein